MHPDSRLSFLELLYILKSFSVGWIRKIRGRFWRWEQRKNLNSWEKVGFFPFYLFYSNMLTLQSIYLLALHTIISVYYSVSSTHLASKCSHSFLWIKKVLLFLLIQFSCSSLILSDMKWRNILRKFTSWPPFYIHLSFMRNWYGSSC